MPSLHDLEIEYEFADNTLSAIESLLKSFLNLGKSDWSIDALQRYVRSRAKLLELLNLYEGEGVSGLCDSLLDEASDEVGLYKKRYSSPAAEANGEAPSLTAHQFTKRLAVVLLKLTPLCELDQPEQIAEAKSGSNLAMWHAETWSIGLIRETRAELKMEYVRAKRLLSQAPTHTALIPAEEDPIPPAGNIIYSKTFRSVAGWLETLKDCGELISEKTFKRRRDGKAIPKYRVNPESKRQSISIAIEDLPPNYSE